MVQHKLVLLLAFLMLVPQLWSQDVSATIAQAKTLVQEKNDYASAEGLLNGASSQDARATSDAFTEIGILEYNRRNYRNAYAAFRAAIRLQATNQTATQYYLRMRREMDVNNLKNEYVPPAPQAATSPQQPTTATATSTAQAADSATAPLATEGRVAQTESGPSAAERQAEAARQAAEIERRNAELQAMMAQLKAAEDRLNAAQSTVSSSQRENETLRRQVEAQRQQVEAQRQMVERLIAQQSARPQTAPAPAANNAQLAEAIRALSEAAQRPVRVETDPTVLQILNEIKNERPAVATSLDPFAPPLLYFTIIMGVVVLVLLVFLALFVAALIRSRQAKRASEYKGSYGIIPVGLENNPASVFLPASANRGLQDGGQSGMNPADSLENQRLMLRADHLQKMYDDARNGKLSWDTIRRYVDDLDKALRNDILRVVETRLNSGVLFSSDAALSVIFPFLTDFDAYISAKAEELSTAALKRGRGPRSTREESGPFSIESLSQIPKKLAEVTKKMDRSPITAQLAYGLALKLGLSNEESEMVYKGALAHDAGYLALDPNKLQRIISKADITDEDWKYLQTHVEKGIEYFNGTTLPTAIRDAILYHHERNDGSGYPRGLKKEDIPLGAKIIGIAETFATLISPRPYRDKHEINSALAIIRDGARRKFDPELVSALEEIVRVNGGSL